MSTCVGWSGITAEEADNNNNNNTFIRLVHTYVDKVKKISK